MLFSGYNVLLPSNSLAGTLWGEPTSHATNRWWRLKGAADTD